MFIFYIGNKSYKLLFMFLHIYNSCMGYYQLGWQSRFIRRGWGIVSRNDNQESQLVHTRSSIWDYRASVSWPVLQRYLLCTNWKCSLVDKLEISTFYEIIVNTKCELFNLVSIWPTGKLQVILDKTIRLVLGTSCLGYESSWIRVVLSASCLWYELSWVRVVHNPIKCLAILTVTYTIHLCTGRCSNVLKHSDTTSTAYVLMNTDIGANSYLKTTWEDIRDENCNGIRHKIAVMLSHMLV